MTRRPTPARTPAALLRESAPLKSLLHQAARLDHLQRLLEGQLQPAARPHCRIASYREGDLLLVTDDGQWATRLRYQQRRLLRQLQGLPEFTGILRIRIKVQPGGPTQLPPRTTHSLSEVARESLSASAEVVADPRLKEALERLAKHGKGRS